jgi:hypothetical protein
MNLPAKVRQGEPIRVTADFFNAVIDVVRWWLGEDTGPGALADRRDRATVLVKNASGADVDRFGVLGIDDILHVPDDNLDGFKNRPCLVGVTPDAEDHQGKFVVMLDAVPDGAIGRGLIQGVVCVKVNVVSNGDPAADIADGDATRLQSGAAGRAQILWKEDGTDEKWALVQLAMPVKPLPNFIAQVTSFAGPDAGGRWTVEVVEVYKAGPQWTDWDTTPGGRSGTAYCYQMVRDVTPGQYGHPAVGDILEIGQVPVADGTVQYWYNWTGG